MCIYMEVLQAPLVRQGLEQPRRVAPRRSERGLLHRDRVEADDGIDGDLARVGLLPHDLPVDLALRRHVDHDVLCDERSAAEAPARGEAAVGRVEPLRLGLRRQRLARAGDPVLRVLALGDAHLAAPADPAAAARRVEVDPESARGVEHRRPARHRSAASRGQEDDTRVAAHASAVALRAARPPRRPAVAPDAPSPLRAIHAAQCSSLPISTSAAFTAWSISAWSGLVIAEVSPDAIAMGRNAALRPVRFGSPKLTFEAPHVELTRSSSRSRPRRRKTWRPAVPIAPIGITRGSTTTSSREMP